MERQVKNRKTRIPAIILAVCLVVFVFSGIMFVREKARERAEDRAFEELNEKIETEATPEALSVSEQGFHKYDELYEMNNDLFGWIALPGAEVSYPVMYTPDDPEHYLRRAFDGSYSVSGVPFLDADCYRGCGNYIVYGHYMKNGTMFGTLSDYADEAYWEEHRTIKFDMVDVPGEYEVIAAFYAKIYNVDDEGVFRYYEYKELPDEETFNEYISQVKAAALYDTGITAVYGDQLLTLSTCSYHTEDGRFVVVAKAKEVSEEPEK